jgi:hypothetical protein
MLERDRRELELVLLDLQRAMDFIKDERTAVCRVGFGMATTTLHMTRPSDSKIFYEINKHYGSQLCGLEEGMHKLRRMLEADTKELNVGECHLYDRDGYGHGSDGW